MYPVTSPRKSKLLMLEIRCASASPHNGVSNPAARTARTRERARPEPFAVDHCDVCTNFGIFSDVSINAGGYLDLEVLCSLSDRGVAGSVGFSASAIATTLSNLWNGMGIEGVFTLTRGDIRAALVRCF